MKALSREEATAWCKTNGIALDGWGFPDRSDADLTFRIPVDSLAKIILVTRAMECFRDHTDVLVWLDDWSVWSCDRERMHLFHRFRLSYGEARPLIQSPAHVFDPTEIDDARSFVALAALLFWDCHVAVPNRTTLFFLSHDEWGQSKGIALVEKLTSLEVIEQSKLSHH